MSYLPELELEFSVPLKDVSVPEKKQAKFECAINKDVPKVMWFRGSDIITSGNNYEIIDDGKKHILIINNCEFDDEGEYTIEVLGKTSTAKLTVEGKWLSFPLFGDHFEPQAAKPWNNPVWEKKMCYTETNVLWCMTS